MTSEGGAWLGLGMDGNRRLNLILGGPEGAAHRAKRMAKPCCARTSGGGWCARMDVRTLGFSIRSF
jgi:hypothetical protein